MNIAHIGAMVRFHRKKARLSQMQLAQLAQVGKTVIFDVENGKTSIRLDTLEKIFKVLNVKIAFSSPLMTQFEASML